MCDPIAWLWSFADARDPVFDAMSMRVILGDVVDQLVSLNFVVRTANAVCVSCPAFAASQKAVRDLGYKVDAIDRANGLLNFKTGMSWKSWAGQEMSLMLIDNGDGSIEVTVSGRRNQSGVVLQIYGVLSASMYFSESSHFFGD